MEVVVVIDGPDGATEKVLASVSDARLRVVMLPNSVGGASARNEGVKAARGPWIALLDDDAEELPDVPDRLEMLASVAEHRNDSRDAPAEQLTQAGADVGAGDGKRGGDLLR